MKTQCERVLEWLDEFTIITPVQAMQQLGIMRLAARISDLKKQGHHIVTETESCRNRYGELVHYARYRKV